MEHFSDRLRRMRKKRQLSQAELARASGLSQGAISSYETGTRKSTTGLIRLAQALKVNPVWLITGSGSMEPDSPDSPPPPANPDRLHESQPQPTTAAWPFESLSPEEYWSLAESQRRIVEDTVAAMISAMRRQDEKN